jgi:putative tryptophan/tyrosine transport system substrate-binding protein
MIRPSSPLTMLLSRHTRRRAFITLLGGTAAAWPLATYAQQPAMPVIGFLDSRSPDGLTDRVRQFRQGMKEIGYVEGENVAIEYRWAEGQFDRLPVLAAELVRRQVAVIVASGGPAVAFAAKAATTTIPTVFIVAEDPVRLGLVASLARPGGNLTGINFYSQELAAKRLELLHELVPAATRVAVLVNPHNVRNTEITLKDAETAARAMGLQIQVLNASNSREVDAAFATLASERPDALFVGVGVLGNELEQRRLIAELYLLSRLVNMHDLVDDLEQRLVVVNLAVMHFLWLAPAAIEKNLGRHNPRHRLGGLLHHDAGQRFDGRAGVR